jgi:hypothetical protein
MAAILGGGASKRKIGSWNHARSSWCARMHVFGSFFTNFFVLHTAEGFLLPAEGF